MNELTPAQLSEIAYRNIRAKAEAHGLTPFIYDVRLKLEDRFFFVGGAQMLSIFLFGSNWKVEKLVSAAHRRVYELFRPEINVHMNTLGLRVHPKLMTARESARPSLQVTWIQFDEFLYGDMDLDLSSWSMDVIGFFTHLLEVVLPGPTNHRKLAEKLRREGYAV